MSGFAKAGTVITSGSNLAIAGQKPSGVAVQGQVIWSAEQWQLLASGVAVFGGPTYTITLDTTGATLIVVLIASWVTVGNTVTDSAGNTWTYTTPVISNTANNKIAYCFNPITSSSHVFSFAFASYETFVALAFKGPAAIADAFSSIMGNNASTLQLPAKSVPNDSIVVSCLNNNTVSTNASIDSNFIIAGVGSYGGGAYLINKVAASVAPTWTIPTAWPQIATMLSFIPSP